MPKKITLEDCKKVAEENLGICLSNKYINSKTHMDWECKIKHKWSATFTQIKRGSWCPTCVKKKSLEDCQKIANIKDGKCLSTEYNNVDTLMEWECKKSHKWKNTFYHIKNRNQWCPHCSGKFNNNLELCQQVAKEKKGECLSIEYKNNRKHMAWKCEKNHIWNAVFDQIKRGSWCPYCDGKFNNNLDLCKEIALLRQGKCLSTKFKNILEPMEWECKKGHKWITNFNCIKNNGTWCIICAGKNKHTLEFCKEIAISKEGKCLSSKYINVDDKTMEWECKEGHIWNTSFHCVYSSNSWCPYCSINKSEKLCRKIFEEETGLKWTSVRPDFLKNNKTGCNLELDGYCEDLLLAFEYQGIQHYEYVSFFHETEKNFEEQKERDILKIKLCRENGIDVVIIPYTLNYKNEDELKYFIKQQLKIYNINLM